MNRCVIYSRVSTNDQTVDNQLKVLREVAERKGLEVVKEISNLGWAKNTLLPLNKARFPSWSIN